MKILQRAIRTRFPDAILEVFGSVATGLFLPDGWASYILTFTVSNY